MNKRNNLRSSLGIFEFLLVLAILIPINAFAQTFSTYNSLTVGIDPELNKLMKFKASNDEDVGILPVGAAFEDCPIKLEMYRGGTLSVKVIRVASGEIVSRFLPSLGDTLKKPNDCDGTSDVICREAYDYPFGTVSQSGCTASNCIHSLSNTRYAPKYEILCGSDGKWNVCDDTRKSVTITGVFGGAAYQCSKDESDPSDIKWRWILPTGNAALDAPSTQAGQTALPSTQGGGYGTPTVPASRTPSVAVCCRIGDNCNDLSETGIANTGVAKYNVGGYFTKNGVNHYCTEQEGAGGSTKPGIFITDLDPKPTANHQQRYQEAKTACINIEPVNLPAVPRPVWTGTRCCGEPSPDDVGEYYNDPNDPTRSPNRLGGADTNDGGCWDSSYKQNGQIIEGTDITPESNKVLSLNGEFMGCNLEPANANDNRVLQKTETGTANPLIKRATQENNMPYCSKAGANPYYICAYKKGWWLLTGPAGGNDYANTLRAGRTDGSANLDYTRKSVHANLIAGLTEPKYPEQCCPANECWDGEKCAGANSETGRNDAQKSVYKCILREGNADWEFMHEKTQLKGGAKGYCDNDNQCLVSLAQKPECVNAREYYKITDAIEINVADNFCEPTTSGGIWTSRTKFVAAQLARFAEEQTENKDYTLYCDTPNKALNKKELGSAAGAIIAYDFDGLTSNNICVLKRNTGTTYDLTIGLTLNKELSQLGTQISNTFGSDISCNPMIFRDMQDADKNRFHRCESGNDELWYNPRLNALVYNKAGITIQNLNGDGRDLLESDPYSRILVPMQPILAKIPNVYPKYNTLFISRAGFNRQNPDGTKIYNKNVYGFLESADYKEDINYIGVLYSGVFSDSGRLCGIANSMVKEGANKLPGTYERLQCAFENPQEGNRAYVFGKSTLEDTDERVWQGVKSYFEASFADLTAKTRIS